MDDEWEFPAPLEDPESRKGGPARLDEGGAKMVPDVNIVEGEMEEGGRKGPSGCPFSSH